MKSNCIVAVQTTISPECPEAGKDSIPADEHPTKNPQSTRWEDQTISNAFMFNAVMKNKNLCLQLLRLVLPELNIQRIKYPQVEKTINIAIDAKSVRLDVYTKDPVGRIYDVEMQIIDTLELPRRSRYYGGMVDQNELQKGQKYYELPKTFIIFICLTDIFNAGLSKYTFRNMCVEDPSVEMGDDLIHIFLNIKGSGTDVSPELGAFLHYVENPDTTITTPFIEQVKEAVKVARQDSSLRLQYASWNATMDDVEERGVRRGEKKGIAIGKTQGEDTFADLGRKLFSSGRQDDLLRAFDDKDFRHSLMKEFGIS